MSTKPRYVRGDKLSAAAKQQVLSSYIYRWTHDNPHRVSTYGACPSCDIRHPAEAKTAKGHNHPTVPLISDAQWLAEHAFRVKKDGSLDPRQRHAEPAFMAGEEVV